MTGDRLIGIQVKYNKTNETGTVVSSRNEYIIVKFPSKEMKFRIPWAFGQKYISCVENRCLQEKMIEEYETTVRNSVPSIKKEENNKIIKVSHRDFIQLGIAYKTHAEAIEECLGVKTKYYYPAYKAFPDKNLAIWFPSIAKEVDGDCIPADTSQGWLNVLAEGRTMIYEKNIVYLEKNKVKRDSLDRLVFAKFDGEEGYRFIGVFRPMGYDEERGFIHKRIGTKYDLNAMRTVD